MLYLNYICFRYLTPPITFNFNKCCIWIMKKVTLQELKQNLTLTSVVFEFVVLMLLCPQALDLTLTSVVFEF